MKASSAWKLLRKFWIDVYARAPGSITTDAGTDFISQAFKDSAKAVGWIVIVQIVPTKACDRFGIVERNRAYLRTVYDKVCINMPYLRKKEKLAMSFRAINLSPSAKTGISLTTLVFVIYPKIPGGRCCGTMMEKANIIRDYTQIVNKMKAKRMICNASHQKSSSSLEKIQKVSKLLLGHIVQMYQGKSGWQPNELVRVGDTDVDVVLPSGKSSTFTINVLCPIYEKKASEIMKTAVTRPSNKAEDTATAISDRQRTIMTKSQTRKQQDKIYGLMVESMDTDFFLSSRIAEMSSIPETGCFQITPETEEKK